jgi:gliding motility-associated lipoprotein GldD
MHIKYFVLGEMFKKNLIPLLACLFVISCNSPYVSKKRGYFKIELPEHAYRKFDVKDFPFSFEYPIYAEIVKDSSYFDVSTESPYWINIDFAQFHSKIFLSYKSVGGTSIYKIKGADGSYSDLKAINIYDKLVNDAYTLTNKNNVVSNSISDSLFKTENGVGGVFFKVGGNAATAKQFFLTDTSRHFLRGALYFDVAPNVDSLKPIQDFIQIDINHMLQTFRWKN